MLYPRVQRGEMGKVKTTSHKTAKMKIMLQLGREGKPLGASRLFLPGEGYKKAVIFS